MDSGIPVKYTSPPIEVRLPADVPVSRADIEFEGVEHGGLSYEARVFLNNPDAGPETPPTADNGYAGSFHVYGFGTQMARPGETLGGAAVVPTQRSITATDAVRRLLGTYLQGGRDGRTRAARARRSDGWRRLKDPERRDQGGLTAAAHRYVTIETLLYFSTF